MKKYLLSLVVFLSVWNVQAHQTEISSTMLVEQAPNNWVLQIRTALTGLDYEIKAKKLAKPYESVEEFQALVLQHVKDNMHIYFNEKDTVSLRNGKVKLGHESSVVFQVVGVPSTINSVYVKNTTFKNIHRNQSALILIKKGFKKRQFTLNNKNDHAMHLKVADAQFIPFEAAMMTAEIPPTSSYTTYVYAGIAFLLLAGLAFLWTKRTRQVNLV